MGNLGNVAEFRLQLFLISNEANRNEHGFHIHVMQGAKTFFKVDLETGKIIGNIDSNTKKRDIRGIMAYITEHLDELKAKANQMRKK